MKLNALPPECHFLEFHKLVSLRFQQLLKHIVEQASEMQISFEKKANLTLHPWDQTLK